MIKNEILKTEYDKQLDEIRKNMVLQSFYKYGPAKHNFGEHLVDPIDTCERCVKKYLGSHNKEYLADAMNYLMFEWMYPGFDDAFYKQTDSDESAGISGMSYNEIKKESGLW